MQLQRPHRQLRQQQLAAKTVIAKLRSFAVCDLLTVSGVAEGRRVEVAFGGVANAAGATAGVGVAAASGACLGAGAGMAGAITVVAGALMAAGAAMGALGAVAASPPWTLTTSGTISSATMLMILISGLTAGPAVSLYGSPDRKSVV